MRRKSIFAVMIAMMLMVLAACGEKSQQDVVQALNSKVEKLSSYKAEAKMTLKIGDTPQVYDVEIWYKKPAFYRVNLKNTEKNQSQMILRNDDGVFVLTPALNKSFRFQSDWPNNSSQAYLYESLVKDIMSDTKATFKAKDDTYIFETKTNYPHSKMLPKQEITFNKKDLTPVSVKVMDNEMNALMTVQFSKVEFNATFEDNAFDTKKNMTAGQLELPAIAPVQNDTFAVLYPESIPSGVNLVEEKKLSTDEGVRMVLTYDGKKSFTLVQEQARVVPAISTPELVSGEPVDLGFTVGALTKNSLSWSYKGVDYIVASKKLTQAEMTAIAVTMQAKMVK